MELCEGSFASDISNEQPEWPASKHCTGRGPKKVEIAVNRLDVQDFGSLGITL